jgi:hypothetical protein
MVDNISELVNLLPILNIAENPQLDEMGQKLKKELTRYSVTTLKNHSGARALIQTNAVGILNEIKDFL